MAMVVVVVVVVLAAGAKASGSGTGPAQASISCGGASWMFCGGVAWATAWPTLAAGTGAAVSTTELVVSREGRGAIVSRLELEEQPEIRPASRIAVADERRMGTRTQNKVDGNRRPTGVNS